MVLLLISLFLSLNNNTVVVLKQHFHVQVSDQALIFVSQHIDQNYPDFQ